MGILKYKESVPGGCFHIFNRGVGRQMIFREPADYRRYLSRLEIVLEGHSVELLCYCLMPNHIHLCVRQMGEVPLTGFISSLHTSHAKYFNKKYERVGHLFQDRFKQKLVDRDAYLLYLTCYIHLNPELDKLIERAVDYPWSSLKEFLGLGTGGICQKEIVYGTLRIQRQSLNDSLNYGRFLEQARPFVVEQKVLKEHLKELL